MENRQLEDNIEQYVKVVKELDPDLYEIKLALLETRVNPRYIPDIIRAISMLAYGTAYGKIEIYMNNGEITQIKTEESTLIKKTTILLKRE